MVDKILFWIGNSATHFGIAKSLQEMYDCELFAIMDIHDNSNFFYKNQKLVNFHKIWFYSSKIENTTKKLDFEYLKLFEKKYDINLWQIAYTERNFIDQYNKYHQFTYNEILLIMQQACRFFEQILGEIKPDFFVTKITIGHNDHLFYSMCKSKGIKIITLQKSRFGYRSIISGSDSKPITKIYNHSNSDKTFDQLQDYLRKFNSFKQISQVRPSIQVDKWKKLRIALEFFLGKNKSYLNHYYNYGKTPLRVIINDSATIISFKRKSRESFFDKNLIRHIDSKIPFIYYPLHFEPERALLIENTYHSNQIELITNIAKSLPINYKLFVKDHPASKKRGWHNLSYYKKIMALPNVELLHPSITPDEIYQKCSLVVSLAGTSAMEAAFYGKPSITISPLFTNMLPSIFHLSKIEDLPNVIKEALMKVVNPIDVNNFITYSIENSFEFDFFKLDKEFNNRFPYIGYLKQPEITMEGMEKFLEDHKREFDLLATEHIKKIKSYKLSKDNN